MTNRSLTEPCSWLKETLLPTHPLAKLNFKSLHVFMAICDAGSFRGAAEQAHITTATVSGHIASLEKLLNASFFDRSNKRKTNVNQQGENLYAMATSAISDISFRTAHVRLETLQTFAAVAFLGHVNQVAKLMRCGVSTVIKTWCGI